MSDALPVTDDQVRPFQEMVGSLARRYDGHCGAEYDDLFQEGQIAVFEALRNGARPSKDIVAKRMRRWVSLCARQGMTDERVDLNVDWLSEDEGEVPDGV